MRCCMLADAAATGLVLAFLFRPTATNFKLAMVELATDAGPDAANPPPAPEAPAAAHRGAGGPPRVASPVQPAAHSVPAAAGPRVDAPPTGELATKIKDVLNAQVNPAVSAHGGEIVLVDVKGTEIFIEMAGGCQGCALSRMTLKQGVERMVRQAVPEITAVHDVTDHGSGENPFY